MEHWDIVIKPRKGLLDIDLKGIWQYRDLFKQYVKRDIVTIYKQTVFGPLWFLIQPILTTVMYKFVFANIAGISTGDIPADLFYMSGVVLWNYFSACFTTGQTVFTGNSNVFSKVYFPRLVAPLSGITSGLIKALIQSIPLIACWIYFAFFDATVSIHLTWEFCLFPLFFLFVALMGLGCGLIVSALTVKYRDLNNLVTFGLQLWMYATPVIYPISITGDRTLSRFLYLNPLQGLFTDFRYMLTGIGFMDWMSLLYSVIFALAILFVGVVIFTKQERTFMDTI
ncbi:MAG: ABC transporter permease [Bacteroidales bacterium]|nr:ABC transporter permease [Bacteroidales bacterium]